MNRDQPTTEQLREAARMLSRGGAAKGGRARAKALSPKRRSAIARMGAAKVNADLAKLEPKKRARLIMRRRTWSAYTAGREARLELYRARVKSPYTARPVNPYAPRAFTKPLHDAWEKGFDTAELPLVAFKHWGYRASKEGK